MKKLRKFIDKPLVTVVLYLVMLALALMFFTGNGQFIYEAF